MFSHHSVSTTDWTHLNKVGLEESRERVGALFLRPAELVVLTQLRHVGRHVHRVDPGELAGERDDLEGGHALQLGQVDAVSAGEQVIDCGSLLLHRHERQLLPGGPLLLQDDGEVGQTGQAGLPCGRDVGQGAGGRSLEQIVEGNFPHPLGAAGVG